MTLDSTLFIKTASSSAESVADLTPEELLVTRSNSRITRVEIYNTLNKIEKLFQVFCKKDDLNPSKGIPVTLHNGVWHKLTRGSHKETLTLGEPVSSVHDFDITIEPTDTTPADEDPTPIERKQPNEDPKEDDRGSTDESIEDDSTEIDEEGNPVDIQIRNSPIQLTPHL